MASAPSWSAPEWARAPERPGVLFLDRVSSDGEVLSSHPIDTRAAFLLGRTGGGADVPAPHATVSRAHAALAHHAERGLVLEDLGSTHGTRLQGGAVLPPRVAVPVRPGDRFRLADSPFEFVVRSTLEDAAERREGEGVGDVRVGAGAGECAAAPAEAGPRKRRWEAAPEPAGGAAPGSAAFAAAAVAATQQAALQQAAALRAQHGLPPLAGAPAPLPGFAPAGAGALATAADKRKLLWGNKPSPVAQPQRQPAAAAGGGNPAPSSSGGEAAFGHNQWDRAEFSDREQKEKFLKLMGAKKGGGAGAPAEGGSAAAVLSRDGQQRVMRDIESQFQQGVRQRALGTRGLGL